MSFRGYVFPWMTFLCMINMETNFLEIIRTRRSYRAYKPEQITDEQLNAVLEAGTYAPTSRGLQSPFIVAVQNEDLKLRLAKMNAEIMGVTTNPYYDAPTYVLVLVPADAPNGIQDASLVLENMMLAAWSKGIGSCCLGSVVPVMNSEEAKPYLERLQLPADYKLQVAIAFGYPAEEIPAAPERDETKAFYVE